MSVVQNRSRMLTKHGISDPCHSNPERRSVMSLCVYKSLALRDLLVICFQFERVHRVKWRTRRLARSWSCGSLDYFEQILSPRRKVPLRSVALRVDQWLTELKHSRLRQDVDMFTRFCVRTIECQALNISEGLILTDRMLEQARRKQKKLVHFFKGRIHSTHSGELTLKSTTTRTMIWRKLFYWGDATFFWQVNTPFDLPILRSVKLYDARNI